MYQYNSETPDPEIVRQEAIQRAKDIMRFRDKITSRSFEEGDKEEEIRARLKEEEIKLGLMYQKPPAMTFLRFEVEGSMNEKWEQTKNIVVIPNPGAQIREDPQNYTVSLLGNGKNIPDKRIVIVSNPLPNVLI